MATQEAPVAEASPRRARRAKPRMPSRGRGVLRFEALLEATDSLLQTETPDSIGLYQIAERAGVPPASVYHFFPTKEAAYQALAGSYLERLTLLHGEPVEARGIQGWQDVLALDVRRAMEFYNANPAVMKILYGGYGGVEARNIDILASNKMANAQYVRMDQVFHMPVLRHPERRFEVRISILDAIFAISVRRHGGITEEYFEEALSACAAYTRLFLPDHLERREALVEAAERGEMIRLPYVSAEGAEAG